MALKPVTQSTYQSRIQQVIDYIHTHLDEPLSLEYLSHIACFSAYHWHRIYQSITGETVKQTIRRLRLQRAAHQLVHSNYSIDTIAKQAGYENTDSFTRKFSHDFKHPPHAYRQKGQYFVQTITQPTLENKTMYDVKIKHSDTLTLATLDHRGDYMEIGQAFDKLFAKAMHLNLLNDNTRSFGIYYDDPNAVPKNELRSKAGISVDANFSDTEELKKVILEPNQYAVIVHKGPYSELESAYQWLYGVWLIDSGYEPADKPTIEEYLNNPKEVAPSELLTAIQLPIAT